MASSLAQLTHAIPPGLLCAAMASPTPGLSPTSQRITLPSQPSFLSSSSASPSLLDHSSSPRSSSLLSAQPASLPPPHNANKADGFSPGLTGAILSSSAAAAPREPSPFSFDATSAGSPFAADFSSYPSSATSFLRNGGEAVAGAATGRRHSHVHDILNPRRADLAGVNGLDSPGGALRRMSAANIGAMATQAQHAALNRVGASPSPLTTRTPFSGRNSVAEGGVESLHPLHNVPSQSNPPSFSGSASDAGDAGLTAPAITTTIDPSLGIPVSAATSGPLSISDRRTQLSITNLPYRVRWQDLKDLFRKSGSVLRADVALTPDNRSRGHGTVLLATEEDANRAVEMFNAFSWQGRVLDVQIDRSGTLLGAGPPPLLPSEMTATVQAPPHQTVSSLSPLAGNTNSSSTTGTYAPHLNPSLPTLASSPLPPPNANNAPSPLPAPAAANRTAALQPFLNGGGGAARGSASTATPPPPPPQSWGTAGGPTRADAGAGHPFGTGVPQSWGRAASGPDLLRGSPALNFRASPHLPNLPRPFHGGGGGAATPVVGVASLGAYGYGGGPPPAGAFGASPMPMYPHPPAQQAHSQIPTSFYGRVLFVGNLPFHCQWQDLKDLFRAAGDIQRADVALGPEGRSRGFGTVLFRTHEDAQNAVRIYHGYEYSNRTLKVHFDRFAQTTIPPTTGTPGTPSQYTSAFTAAQPPSHVNHSNMKQGIGNGAGASAAPTSIGGGSNGGGLGGVGGGGASVQGSMGAGAGGPAVQQPNPYAAMRAQNHLPPTQVPGYPNARPPQGLLQQAHAQQQQQQSRSSYFPHQTMQMQGGGPLGSQQAHAQQQQQQQLAFQAYQQGFHAAAALNGVHSAPPPMLSPGGEVSVQEMSLLQAMHQLGGQALERVQGEEAEAEEEAKVGEARERENEVTTGASSEDSHRDEGRKVPGDVEESSVEDAKTGEGAKEADAAPTQPASHPAHIDLPPNSFPGMAAHMSPHMAMRMTPGTSLGVPMTPGMPGFTFAPFPLQTPPPMQAHFLSPGLGPFSPPAAAHHMSMYGGGAALPLGPGTPLAYGVRDVGGYINPAPGAPVHMMQQQQQQQPGTPGAPLGYNVAGGGWQAYGAYTQQQVQGQGQGQGGFGAYAARQPPTPHWSQPAQRQMGGYQPYYQQQPYRHQQQQRQQQPAPHEQAAAPAAANDAQGEAQSADQPPTAITTTTQDEEVSPTSSNKPAASASLQLDGYPFPLVSTFSGPSALHGRRASANALASEGGGAGAGGNGAAPNGNGNGSGSSAGSTAQSQSVFGQLRLPANADAASSSSPGSSIIGRANSIQMASTQELTEAIARLSVRGAALARISPSLAAGGGGGGGGGVKSEKGDSTSLSLVQDGSALDVTPPATSTSKASGAPVSSEGEGVAPPPPPQHPQLRNLLDAEQLDAGSAGGGGGGERRRSFADAAMRGSASLAKP